MPAGSATKILARNFEIDINTGTVAVPVWTKIGGITSFSVDASKSDADTTDFDSAGWAEHMVASRSATISLEGFRKEDLADGARDAGQAAVESVALLSGPASIVGFRYFHLTSRKGKSFSASANVTGPGGGNDDAAAWGAELTVSNQFTAITVP